MKYSEAKQMILTLREHGWARTKEPAYVFRKMWRRGGFGHRRFMTLEELIHMEVPLDVYLLREDVRAEQELDRFEGGFLEKRA